MRAKRLTESRQFHTAVPLVFAVILTGLIGNILQEAGAHSDSYSPRRELLEGGELVVVFIGAGFCGAHTSPGFDSTIETMKSLLEEKAAARGLAFATSGVALDWAIEDGTRFLESFGPFDEIVVGRNWLNSAAIKYFWRDYPGRPGIPQVVVLQRDLEIAKRHITVSNEGVIARKVGIHEIRAWVDRGAPLP